MKINGMFDEKDKIEIFWIVDKIKFDSDFSKKQNTWTYYNR